MTRYANESTAEKRCQMVVDWTCDDDGERDEEIICGQTAEWVSAGNVLACSDCYHAHDEVDRADFRYLDDASRNMSDTKEET